jgi:hypothetical protein
LVPFVPLPEAGLVAVDPGAKVLLPPELEPPALPPFLPLPEVGLVAVEPGVVAAEPGFVAVEPGLVAAEPGVVAAEPGVVAVDPVGAVAAEPGAYVLAPPEFEPPPLLPFVLLLLEVGLVPLEPATFGLGPLPLVPLLPLVVFEPFETDPPAWHAESQVHLSSYPPLPDTDVNCRRAPEERPTGTYVQVQHLSYLSCRSNLRTRSDLLSAAATERPSTQSNAMILFILCWS